MHAVTMPMVENLGSPHISCLDHLAGQAIDYSGHTPRVPDSYRSVILDIRIVGDVRLQRVLDRLFAPGRGSRVEVIDLAALWAEVEA